MTRGLAPRVVPFPQVNSKRNDISKIRAVCGHAPAYVCLRTGYLVRLERVARGD